MKNLPSNLRNLKSKVYKLDVDKSVPVPVDLSKLSDVVKNDVVKKGVYNAKIENIEDKIPNITNLATTTAATAAENKIPDHSKYISTPEFNKLTAEHFFCKISTSKFSKQN